jgi:hypothetical protein
MRHLFLIALSIFTLIFTGCTNSQETNSNSNVKPANSNTAVVVNSNSQLGTTKTPEAATTNTGATIAPVIDGYYEALQKKDEAGVKKYLSAELLKKYEAEAKAEKKTWLAYLLEIEDPVSEKREVRNEKIEGSSAIAEVKGGSLAVWTKYGFVKENGEWKIAPESPEDFSKPASNSSAAR